MARVTESRSGGAEEPEIPTAGMLHQKSGESEVLHREGRGREHRLRLKVSKR